MKINWFFIKDEIRKETQEIFLKRGYDILHFNNLIEVFIEILKYPIDDYSLNLDGVGHRMPLAMQKAFSDDVLESDKALVFPDLVKIEPFLKKIWYLLSPHDYNVNKSKLTLAPLIKKTNINPSQISFSQDNLEDLIGKPYFADHLFRVYHLRNIESHVCKNWSRTDFYTHLSSTLIIYLFAIEQNLQNLTALVDPDPNFEEYNNEFLKNHGKLLNQFIDTEGEETGSFEDTKFDIYVVETDWSEENENTVEQNDRDTDEYNEILRQKRKGKIIKLREEITQFIIFGEPGIGKTTTLRYLSLNDIKQFKIPIYIELKSFNIQNSLEKYIRSSLSFEVSNKKWKQFLTSNKFHVYLDGFNEIIDGEVRSRLKDEIRTFIGNYPSLPLIISTRPTDEIFDFKIPVLVLQKLTKEQILEYIKKNFDPGLDGISLFSSLEKKKRLFELSQNPFMLGMLVSIAKSNAKKIPDNTGLLIRTFFHYLLKREENRDTKFIKNEVFELLKKLAFQTRNNKKVTFYRDQILKVFSSEKQRLGLNLNLIQTLEKLEEINVIDNASDAYYFRHELYQEYFMAEEIVSYVLDDKLDYKFCVENSYYHEPILFCSGLLSENQRVLFIDNLSKYSCDLAAKAFVLSSNNDKIKKNLIKVSIEKTKNIQDISSAVDGLSALTTLGEKQYFIDVISSIVHSTNDYSRLYQVFKIFAQSIDPDSYENFFSNIVSLSNRHIVIWLLKFISQNLIEVNPKSISAFLNSFLDNYFYFFKSNTDNIYGFNYLIYILLQHDIDLTPSRVKEIIYHGLKTPALISPTIRLIMKRHEIQNFEKSELLNSILDNCKRKDLYSILDLDLNNNPPLLIDCVYKLTKKGDQVTKNYFYYGVACELLLNYRYGFDSYLVETLEKLMTVSIDGFREYLKLRKKYPKLKNLFPTTEIINNILSNARDVATVRVAEKLIGGNNLFEFYDHEKIAKQLLFSENNKTFITGIEYIKVRNLTKTITIQNILELAFDECNYYRNLKIIPIAKAIIKAYGINKNNIYHYMQSKNYKAIVVDVKDGKSLFQLIPFQEYGVIFDDKLIKGQIVDVKLKYLDFKTKKANFKLFEKNQLM